MIRLFSLATRLAGACALCLAVIPAARANLVANGGFETEAATPAIPPPSWTAGGTGMAVVGSSFAHSGTYAVGFTATSSDSSPGTLSQAIATTSGQAYTLSFWLLDDALLPGNDAFDVSFGGFTSSFLGSSLTASTYTQVTLSILGSDVTSTSTTLSFQGLADPDPTGLGLGPGGPFYLDDVSLTANAAAVPEPSAGALLLVGLALILPALRRRRV